MSFMTFKSLFFFNIYMYIILYYIIPTKRYLYVSKRICDLPMLIQAIIYLLALETSSF